MKNFIQLIVFAGFLSVSSISHAGDFKLSSTDISEGQKLKSEQVFNGFGCKGGNISPALKWTGAPKGTKSFVITAYDPDAPTGSGWWHWTLANIPANVTSLPANAGNGKNLPKGALQTKSDYGTTGFGGACPPPGEVHRYIFTVYALKTDKLAIKADSSNALVGFMTKANAIAQASITAVYNR
ncbi:MAG: YbhB/YbcL family Raf kinase inhibitor-like protein [Methyloligellaceae bacterium]